MDMDPLLLATVLTVLVLAFLGCKGQQLVARLERTKRVQEFSGLSLWQQFVTHKKKRIFEILEREVERKRTILLRLEKDFHKKFGKGVIQQGTEFIAGCPEKIIFYELPQNHPESGEFPTNVNSRTPSIEMYHESLALYNQIRWHDMPHYNPDVHFDK